MNPGSIRASDRDRDQVAEVLHTAFAEGRINQDEHAERLDAAIRAKTFDDLIPLTADLVPVSPLERSRSHSSSVAQGGNEEPDRMTAAMAEVKRDGQWRVRRRSLANVFLGSVKLDFTEASFEAPRVEVVITQCLGNVFLRVPAGTTIVDETTRVMADVSIKGVGEPDPAYPTIVLKGTNILGEIKVRGPKKQLIWKKALA